MLFTITGDLTGRDLPVAGDRVKLVKNFGDYQHMRTLFRFPCVILLSLSAGFALQQHRYEPAIELQPLAAQARRVVEAMDYLGAPIASQDRTELSRALGASDSAWLALLPGEGA